MGYKNKGSKVNYLVFADDIVVVTVSLEEAAEPDNPAPRTSKAGLWTSYNKSQYMTNFETVPRWILLWVKESHVFKYMGELVESNLSEKESLI